MQRRRRPARGDRPLARSAPRHDVESMTAIALKAPRPRWTFPSLALALALAACRGDGTSSPVEVIDRETFIATYVDLRTTALESGAALIGDEDRAEVLARHGVSEQDLTRFVEERGEDVEFMRDVWDEIERRLDSERPAEDQGDPGAAG